MITAILVLDYWVIRKGAWKIPDLYKGGPQYLYWYWHGINIRACAVYIISVIPSMPGLVMNIMGKLDSPAVKIYQITYLFGLGLGSSLYMAVNLIWPVSGLGFSEAFDAAEVEGIALPSRDGSADGRELPNKEAVVSTVRDVKV